MRYLVISINEVDDSFIEHVRKNYPLRYERALKFKFHDDFLRSIGAYILLERMIGQFDEKDVYYNEYQKPFIKGKEYFSISHSGEYILVATNENEIGADIEQIKDTNLKLAKKVFNEEENEFINEENSTNRFHMLWCKKESGMKLIGKGLSLPFKDVYVMNPEEVIINEKSYQNLTILYKSDYAISISWR